MDSWICILISLLIGNDFHAPFGVLNLCILFRHHEILICNLELLVLHQQLFNNLNDNSLSDLMHIFDGIFFVCFFRLRFFATNPYMRLFIHIHKRILRSLVIVSGLQTSLKELKRWSCHLLNCFRIEFLWILSFSLVVSMWQISLALRNIDAWVLFNKYADRWDNYLCFSIS